MKYDNCKDCVARCVHAGKDREFICGNGVSCKVTKKPVVTNADKIRAMSDEELADTFLRADFCKCCEHNKDGVCNYICAYPNIPPYDGCIQAALTWMKQPAEEES